MNRSFVTLALLAAGFVATPAFAAPADLFFSTTPFPTAATLTPSNPTLNLTVGQTATLYMWVAFPNTDDTLNALGVYVDSSSPILTANTASLDNYTLTTGSGKSQTITKTWDSVSNGTPNGAGHLFQGLDAFALTAHGLDPNFDADADNGGLGTTLYFGSITFTATGAGSTNLKFATSHLGSSYTLASPDVTTQFLNYGAGDSAVSGATEFATSSLPDATIVVTGTPEPASLGLLALGGLALIARRRKA